MSHPRLIGLLLVLITLLVYLPASRDGFVNYDDQDYVTENSVVQKGLTWTGIKWAFTTGHASNWHPLTWLSHLADCELFGLNPGAHHLVNVLFHTANVVLLLVLLLRLTDKLWLAAFIAALFAWHPLHVESVAWISERKDVLSTFFALLTLLAYTRYAQKRSKVERRESMAKSSIPALDPRPLGTAKRSEDGSTFDYALALFFFTLGLMSKPMLVTLPFVMLLLDYWPLQRLLTLNPQPSTGQRLALEKWPFFLLATVSCVVTFLVQSQRSGAAVASLELIPLHYRFGNALVSYGLYLLKMVWPVGLAVFYPLPDHLPWLLMAATASAVVLVIISSFVWRAGRAHAYLPVGWLWFLGTLVPVIGLVQVGGAALADRYTYIPSIGVFIAVTFGVCDLADRFQFPKKAIAIAAALILATCLILTENQLRYWHDSETLFAHALAVTKNNHVAHVNLGVALEQEGKLNEALAEYRAAEQLAPELYHIHNNLGNLLDNLGHPNKALIEYRWAVLLNPSLPSLHNGAGIVLAELRRFDEAMRQFKEATRLDPTYPWAHLEIGRMRLKQGRDAEAIDEFRAALRIDPNNFQILAYTAHVLSADENPQIRDGRTALVLAIKAKLLTGETQPYVLDALGMACAETGNFTNALEEAQRAIDLARAAKMKKLEPLQQRLELYKNHRPWRESFLATNPPAKH
ncbi:MAG: tetratricopeptide repeat protein [Verrucomicrobiota bacterium]|jgi:tetratricopeptide (TPR) repeat protein